MAFPPIHTLFPAIPAHFAVMSETVLAAETHPAATADTPITVNTITAAITMCPKSVVIVGKKWIISERITACGIVSANMMPIITIMNHIAQSAMKPLSPPERLITGRTATGPILARNTV